MDTKITPRRPSVFPPQSKPQTKTSLRDGPSLHGIMGRRRPNNGSNTNRTSEGSQRVFSPHSCVHSDDVRCFHRQSERTLTFTRTTETKCACIKIFITLNLRSAVHTHGHLSLKMCSGRRYGASMFLSSITCRENRGSTASRL